MTKYDLVVIGSGPGGEVGAIRAAQLGLKTALVEKDAHLGGTCLNWGCIPTKALLESAKNWVKFQHAEELGFSTGKVQFDWQRIMARKQGVVDAQRKGLRFLMKKNKIDTFEGFGRLKDQNTVTVKGAEGKATELSAKNILVATGSHIRDLPFAKPDGKAIINSDQILSLEKVPKSLCIVGGGVVGTEFASLYGRFSCEVTIVEMADQILPSEDPECVKELIKDLRKQNVTIKTGVKITDIKGKGKEAVVELEGQKAMSFEKVLVAIGRAPSTTDIGLDEVGISTEQGFIAVDDHYRTKVSNVFAIGDVIATPMLAHTASAEAMHAVEVIAGHTPPLLNYEANPNSIYTYPEIASIGQTVAALETAKVDFKVAKFPFAPNAKAKIEGGAMGFIKLLYDPQFKEVLGVHIVGARATELIAEFALGKVLETTVDEIGHTIHPHPTISETVMEVAHAAMGGAIHM